MVSTRRSLLTRAAKLPQPADDFPKKKPRKSPNTKPTIAKKGRGSPAKANTKKAAAVSPSPTKASPAKKTLFAYSKPTTSPILSLTETDDLIPVKLVNRPSKRNRSPYVADVLMPVVDDKSDPGSNTADKELGTREAICHVPNLDMGGKCVPGATLLVKPARDRKGNLVGPNAVNPKYNTPKCEVIAQLLRVDETSLGYGPSACCWVGAHPSLGEKIAEQLLLRNSLPQLPPIESIQREVRNVAGTDMRADFLIEFVDKTKHRPCVLEVKTVVDTDYAKGRTPTDRTKCVFVSQEEPYRRAGIFPWGQSNQKGPKGEPVVSARAIKHVQELTRIAKGTRKGPNGETYQAAVLFVVIRKDAEYFRANHEACPSFCKYLKEAQDAGVQVMAKRVDWGDTPDTLGQCLEGPLLDVEWPSFKETK